MLRRGGISAILGLEGNLVTIREGPLMKIRQLIDPQTKKNVFLPWKVISSYTNVCAGDAYLFKNV